MAKLLIKKFSLRHNGKNYGAGSVVELPDAEAMALADNAPAEFAIIEEGMLLAVEPETHEGSFSTENEHDALDVMNVAQLKKYAKDNGIDIGTATKKQELMDIINAAEAEVEEADGLPDIDPAAMVK